MVSSESPVPLNTNKTAKYTNCAMLHELKRSTPYNSRSSLLCGMNSFGMNSFSFRFWFRDGMCSAGSKTLLLISRNAIYCWW